MSTQHIEGTQLKNMIISGANNLENNKALVNALNVFPVPDGDTGTNMSLTIQSAVKEIKNARDNELYTIAEAAANGSLMGARGNSGVILSQIFRGFAKAMKTDSEVNIKVLANALMEGSNTAYKAIMKPTEGTILTVIRETGEHAVKIADRCSDALALMEEVVIKANKVLEKTPEMLPVLKNAGVVDAGGKGLIYILEGMYQALKTGALVELNPESEMEMQAQLVDKPVFIDGEIRFGYCTEFFIKAKQIDREKYKNAIADLGDSQVVVGDENLVKVHIHTNNPGKVLELALQHGELSKIKIDNMREQHRALLVKEEDFKAAQEEESKAEDAPMEKYGAVTVAMGEGISDIFRDLGANEIIEGGQTMNPSTEDILKSVNKVNAENVFIFPNNSNIILAANQAKSLSKKNVAVAPTKTIPQGIAAIMALDYDRSIEENIKKIEKAITGVKSGLITYAVRNSTFDGINIEEGNILGMVEGKIKNVGENTLEVSTNILAEMVDEDSSLISIYYGNDITEEEAQKLVDHIGETYPDCEIELHYGGQPLYYYILSVE
ncbi:MAG: DAK2 domain-containing protein [Caulobacteraceae bacterium]